MPDPKGASPSGPDREGPVRTCIGCGAKKPQEVLIRFVKSRGDQPVIGRLLPGRGCYVCPDKVCVKRLERRLRRSFEEKELQRTVEALRCFLEEDRSPPIKL